MGVVVTANLILAWRVDCRLTSLAPAPVPSPVPGPAGELDILGKAGAIFRVRAVHL